MLDGLGSRFLSRFFDQVGHETTYASSGNKHFSINNVTVRLTKIMNNLLKHHKVLIFKIISFGKIRPILKTEKRLRYQNFKMFKEVVHNFGKSGSDKIY